MAGYSYNLPRDESAEPRTGLRRPRFRGARLPQSEYDLDPARRQLLALMRQRAEQTGVAWTRAQFAKELRAEVQENRLGSFLAVP